MASQYLLKKQYQHIGSLRAPSLIEKLAMKPPGKEFVQILNVTGNHWVTDLILVVGLQGLRYLIALGVYYHSSV